ncbi:hypothetical protein [Shewanella dokdonensis]|nr:hypothetical protein [Shewanella dokdonensis]MCL1072996.1 hypothetical protein [Shewanella dokdonensis]
MAFDFLTGSVSDYLSGSSNVQVQTPTLATSPMSTGFFSQANDFLAGALNNYMTYTQIQNIKDSGTAGQKEVQQTVQTPNPNSDQTYVSPGQQQAQQMAAGLTSGLKIGTGTLLAIGGGILVLWYLSRK